MEQQFIEAWSKITLFLREQGSLGSRLHQGDDGLWYAYAQWPNEQMRLSAFDKISDIDSQNKMREAIEQHYPEVQLKMVADFLI